jgi:predicted deacylase
MPTRELHTVPVTTLANGHRVELTVHTVRGDKAGPRLGLVSGVHGDEPLAVETVRRVLEMAAGSADFAGEIVAVPVANPYAHLALERNTPLDGANLNRIFPGAADGSLTEQVAHALLGIFLGRIDCVIDFHSGGNFACVDYAYIHDDGAELSRVYGTRLLYRGPGYPGSFTSITRDNGIPAVVSELGGGSQRIGHYLDQGVRGATNVMRHLGMLDGPVRKTEGQRIVDELVILRPRSGGILLSQVGPDRLGEEVAAGTVLGRVINPHTFEELEVIKAPFESTIMVLTRPEYTNVNPGDYGYMVANGATAIPA